MHRYLTTALGALALALGGAAVATAPAEAASGTLHLEHLAARVIIIPEARDTIHAEVRNSGKGGLARPQLTVNGADLTVSSDLDNTKLHNCHVKGFGHGVKLGFFKSIPEENLPVITVRTPMDVQVVVDGAVEGEIAAARSVSLTQKRCGDWKVADVADHFEYDLEGVSDLNAGAARSTTIRLEGMGDVHVRSTGSLDASLQGMGDITVDQVNGPVKASLQGMGDLKIKGGHATEFQASLEGMGDIRFDGVADTVDASADGMGDVKIAKATGQVSKSQNGFAKVIIGK
jgi:Putative auto-transporter adhesin, head GIN domain